MAAEIVLKGGTVIDGTGAPPRQAHVAISGGKIVEVGHDVSRNAQRVIDVSGRVVVPGFIDMHTHSDTSILTDPACESKVLQGVTTDVTGNCGMSPFPIEPSRLELHLDNMGGRGVGEDGVPLTWTDLDGYADVVHATPPAFNVAPLVGHHTLRTAGMGLDEREPSDDELATMQRLLAQLLDQGAFGFSTGLTLVPGTYATEAEVTALVGVTASRDALYATHTRGADLDDCAGVEEPIRTATAAGARLQFSHAAIGIPDRWGRAGEVTARIDEARAQGLDIAFDVYPYDASSSALTQFVPPWVQAGGFDAMRRRLADPAAYDRALAEFAQGRFGLVPWYWDRVLVAGSPAPDDWCVGLTIEEAAARRQVDPTTFALQLCIDHGNAVRVIQFYRTEEDMMTFLAHPLAMVGSDGYAMALDQQGAKPHPRSYGTYPRIFGRYVREKGLLTLSEAVRKCTGVVADRLGMSDRGYVREAAVADVAVFDPATVADRATFSDPGQAPVGVDYVLVAGEVVVDGGDQTEARPGRVLRRPGHGAR